MGGDQKSSPTNSKLLEQVDYAGRAIDLPSNDVFTVKCLDLDRCNSDLDASNSKATAGKSYSTSQPVCSEQSNNDEVIPFESVDQRDISLKKSRTKTEQLSSTSEKDAKSRILIGRNSQTQSGPLVPAVVLNHSKSERIRSLQRCENEKASPVDKIHHQKRRAPSFSGPLDLPNRASGNSLSAPVKPSGGYRDLLDDKSKENLVQIKGRFSVTSENIGLVKELPLRKTSSFGDSRLDLKHMPNAQSSKKINGSILHNNVHTSMLMPHLQNLLEQTSVQQELILNMMTSLQSAVVEASQNGKLPPSPGSSENNGAVEVSDRERLLLIKISELESTFALLTEELTAEKLKYLQLQRQADAITSGEDGNRGEGGA